MEQEMIIDCVSDCHGSYPELPGGELLIVAGDLTARDLLQEHADFYEWLDAQTYVKKIVIAGNHDGIIDGDSINCLRGCSYLKDSGCLHGGFRIWGSPWTPIFCDWHFMLSPYEIRKKWALIPEDTDILITHGPPFGTLDKVSPRRSYRCGCEGLADRLTFLRHLKLHVFGHIHGSYGMIHPEGKHISVNCAHMDEDYRPVNKPIRVVLGEELNNSVSQV